MGHFNFRNYDNENDGCGWFAAVIIVLFIIFVFLVYEEKQEKSNSAVEQPAHVELNPEHWNPAIAPRDDVDCWRSGHSVVCLPKNNTSSESHK